MRLFIASPATIHDIDAIRSDIAPTVRGRWTASDLWHLTWYFIGESDDAQPYIRRLRGIPLRFERPIPLNRLATFGKPPHILYATGRFEQFEAQAEALAQAGLLTDRFTPHVTLCRIKAIEDAQALQRELRRPRAAPLGYVLPQLVLYRSVLTPQGARYQALFTHQAL